MGTVSELVGPGQFEQLLQGQPEGRMQHPE
jgi:hypothetical protein